VVVPAERSLRRNIVLEYLVVDSLLSGVVPDRGTDFRCFFRQFKGWGRGKIDRQPWIQTFHVDSVLSCQGPERGA